MSTTQDFVQKSSDGTAVSHLDDSIIYQNSGKIGIGTTTIYVSTKCHVYSDVEDGTALMAQTADDNGVALKANAMAGGTAVSANNGQSGYALHAQSDNSGIAGRFFHYSGSSFATILAVESDSGAVTSRLVVKGNGNTGIGTSSPDKLLSVKGDMIVGQDITSGNSKIVLGEEDASNKSGCITYNRTNNTIDLRISGSTDPNGLYVKSGGSVGIGTSAPTAKLHVDGEIRMKGCSLKLRHFFHLARLDTPFGHSASAKNGHRVQSVSRCPRGIDRLPNFKAAPE
jgi:hypothetical protein